MPYEIVLDGQYEVALAEIIYPRTWSNIFEGDNEIWIYKRKEVPIPPPIRITPGFYPSQKEIKNQLTRSVKKRGLNDFVLRYNSILDRFEFGGEDLSIYTKSPLLGKLFGMREPINGYFVPPHDPEATKKDLIAFGDRLTLESVPMMFVYTDIIEHQIVGRAQAPLLRTFKTEGVHGEITAVSFQNLHYKTVAKKEFGSIEVRITDGDGKDVDFSAGDVTLILHFRQKV